MKLQTISKEYPSAKIALQGPSGAGKSYSALLLAHSLSGSYEKVAVIETDYNAANHYSHLGSFNTIVVHSPAPELFQDAIELCERSGIEVIILDSLSFYFQEKTWLDLSNPSCNDNSHWEETLFQTIQKSNCHIIATLQVREEYHVIKHQGWPVVEKIGLEPRQRADIHEYFHSVLALDTRHIAKAYKDRTGFFEEHGPMMITEQAATHFAHRWTKGGKLEVNPNQQQIEANPIFNRQKPDSNGTYPYRASA